MRLGLFQPAVNGAENPRSVIRLESNYTGYEVLGPPSVGLPDGALPIDGPNSQSLRRHTGRENIVGVDLQHAFAKIISRLLRRALICGIVVAGQAPKGQILGGRVPQSRTCVAGGFNRIPLNIQCSGDARDDLVPHRQKIGAIRVELICPKMRRRPGADELRVQRQRPLAVYSEFI